MLAVEGVSAGYGRLEILHKVSLDVACEACHGPGSRLDPADTRLRALVSGLAEPSRPIAAVLSLS